MLLTAVGAPAAEAQELPVRDTAALRAEAYRDPLARTLIEAARAARDADLAGMDSYEALLRERIYVGLTGLRFRRERGIFEQERIARIRWQADGARAVQWVGARRRVPVIGADTRSAVGTALADRDFADTVRVRRSRPDSAAPGGVAPQPGDTSDVEAVGSDLRADSARSLRRRQREEEGRRRREERDDTLSLRLEVGANLADELRDELVDDPGLPDLVLDPTADRLELGGDWALHPLSDTAALHYRFSSGDTLTLRLPDRDLRLLEVRVEPRRAEPRLLAGSLWFEDGTGSLVRAVFKPARPFDMSIDDEGFPGILQPAEAEIVYITVEYSLQEFRHWLPRRFALEGEARLASLVRIPLTVEWTVGDYRVNEAESDIALSGPLPEGWSRVLRIVEGGDGEPGHQMMVVLPPDSALFRARELAGAVGVPAPVAFSDDEIDEIRARLEQVTPGYRRLTPHVAWGLERGLVRFNRVEGLSLGVAATSTLSGSTTLDVEARIGTGDREPNVTVGLAHQRGASAWTVSGYHRLESLDEEHDPFGLVGSLTHLLFGGSRSQFVRVTGGSAGVVQPGRRAWRSFEAFHERHRPVELETGFHLLELVRDREVEHVVAADRTDLTGVRGRLRWSSGIDPMSWTFAGELHGELARSSPADPAAGVGPVAEGADAPLSDEDYARAAASLAATHPLPLGLAGALEVAGGAAWGGRVPLQRQFFLGGSRTVRGFDRNSLVGDAFWRGRAELATGFAGARLSLFGDAAWAGPREAFTLDDPAVSTGLGFSLLDGLARLDVARGVRRGSSWKVHFYLDGIF